MEPMASVDEIAPDIFRISTWIPDITPDGFTFNQFLVRADEPLLFHCGHRGLFPQVAEAVAKIDPVESLRWITFGHVEADECGSMNMWLTAAPDSQVAHGALGCMVSLNDLCDRPPRPLAEGEVLDIGGKRLRQISTPHVPHGWEAQVLFDETTRTLFCGDLFTQMGEGPAIVHDADLIQPAIDAEDLFGATALTARTAPTLRMLAELEPRTLALMHGPAYAGDGRQALLDLADVYEQRLRASIELATGGAA